jgi:hypothetical protein
VHLEVLEHVALDLVADEALRLCAREHAVALAEQRRDIAGEDVALCVGAVAHLRQALRCETQLGLGARVRG